MCSAQTLSTLWNQGMGYPHHLAEVNLRLKHCCKSLHVYFPSQQNNLILKKVLCIHRHHFVFIHGYFFILPDVCCVFFFCRTVRVWLKRDSGQYWPSIYHAMPCKYEEMFTIYCVFAKWLFWFWWSFMLMTICKLTLCVKYYSWTILLVSVKLYQVAC